MLTRITLTAHVSTADEEAPPASISVTPSALLTDSADQIIIAPVTVDRVLSGGSVSIPGLITTDNPGINPVGWAYHITLTSNSVKVVDGLFELPSTWGESVDLAQLVQVSAGPALTTLYGVLAQGYTNTWLSQQTFEAGVTLSGGVTLAGMPIANPPGGTDAFLRADGTWDVPPGGSGGGAVASVNDQTGAVTLTASDVGAIPVSSVAAANGVASLNSAGQVPASQLPARSVTIPMQTYSVAGPLVAMPGTLRWYADRPWTLVSVRASVSVAPAGSSIILDVLKNGASVFTTAANRATIAPGMNTGVSGAPDITSIAAGDYLTVSVLQVGSSTSGSDLTVTINATTSEG